MEQLSLGLLRVSLIDFLGFAACGATLCTFAQKRMVPMRICAIAANVFFIGYGALGLLYPVLMLHLVLLPLNVGRLFQLEEHARVSWKRPLVRSQGTPYAAEKHLIPAER